ncbi:MAG TPA: hypothetical protein VN673_11490, partial [Clostridia bacterium]|nr:hypothetical protein [Clostridia bacterium]
MKGGTTPVRLVWHNGRPFGALAKALVDYFQGKGVRLGLDPSGHGIFNAFVHIPDQPLKYTDAPWDADPWLEPETESISWRFLEADGTEWGWFCVRREQNQPLMPEGQPPTVYVMLLSFDGHLLSHRGENPEEFETLVRKYEQLKDIFRILDCDEVFAWDEMFVYDTEFQSHFPFERDKVFRFAKEGTQVLV